MANKRTGILMTALATILSFLCVAYMSCSKTPSANPKSCDNVLCQNGGYCDSGACVCPAGYEGARCATVSLAKYLNYWNVDQKIVGSSNLSSVGRDSFYTMTIQASATPTAFFLYNFYGNPNYNKIACVIDTLSTSTFKFDTVSSNQNFHMTNDGLFINGGHGSIATDDSSITAFCYTSKSGEIDTLLLTFTQHHF